MSSAYERWVSANDKLIKCFKSVGEERYKSLSTQEQGQLCTAERDAVRQMLSSDELHFRNII